METLDCVVFRHRDRLPKSTSSALAVRQPVRTASRTETRYRRHDESQDTHVKCPECSRVFSTDKHTVVSQSRHSAVRSRSPVQRPPVPIVGLLRSPHHSSSSSPRHSPSSPPRSAASPTFLVAGGTGVGKSYYISLLSDRRGRGVTIGNSLESCTANVKSFPCVGPDGSKFNLIDSPGFDDSRLSDAEVLTKLARFLSELYAASELVHGIIFIHRITDVRLSGSFIKIAQIIKRICGDQFKGRYALVTSMWDLIRNMKEKELAYRREYEMVRHPHFWDEIRPDDFKSFRFSGTRESAHKVVDWFLDPRNTFLRNPPRLQLPMQMREGKLVSETDAGVFVLGELSKQRQQHVEAVQELRREISEARQDHDLKAVKIYSEIQAREEFSIHQNDLMQRTMRLKALPMTQAYR